MKNPDPLPSGPGQKENEQHKYPTRLAFHCASRNAQTSPRDSLGLNTFAAATTHAGIPRFGAFTAPKQTDFAGTIPAFPITRQTLSALAAESSPSKAQGSGVFVMTDLDEQVLIDEIVAQFIRRCEHLWPGIIVTVRHTPEATSPDANRPDEGGT